MLQREKHTVEEDLKEVKELTDVADALAEGPLDGEHLVHNFRRGQAPCEAASPRRAEAAPHGAAHLRHRRQHVLNQRAEVQAFRQERNCAASMGRGAVACNLSMSATCWNGWAYTAIKLQRVLVPPRRGFWLETDKEQNTGFKGQVDTGIEDQIRVVLRAYVMKGLGSG